MKSLVSILIPAYNAEKWIADTIRSALAQTWPNKEIIIVDDGSRDNTLSIARQFSSRDVSIVAQENQGASGARNKALALYQGDYVQWLDADDLLAPDKIEMQMRAIRECPSKRTVFSSPWGYFFYRPERAEFLSTPLWADLPSVDWLIRKMGQNLHMQTATWLVSRELTEAAGPWDTRLWRDNDGEYFCRVIIASDGVRFVPEAKTFYRMAGQGSVTYIGRSTKKQDALWLSMQLHIGYLLSLEDTERTRNACLSYLQTWVKNFYPDRKDIFNEAQQIAAGLGGKLEIPRLRAKYAWLQPIVGYATAKRAQAALPEIRVSFARIWDKLMSNFSSRDVSRLSWIVDHAKVR